MTGLLEAAPSARPSSGMTTRVVRGGLWSMGGQVATLAASFVATPFTIRLLGPESYGLLALVNALIGYMAFADLGMGLASTKFGAEAHARGDDEQEAAVVWTSLLIALVPSLLIAAGLWLAAAPLIDRVFHVQAALRAPAIVAVRLAALGYVARGASGVLNSPQLARLRIDLNTLITTGGAVAQLCLVPVVLVFGGGLEGAVAVVAGSAGVVALLHAVASRRLLPCLGRPRFDRGLVGPLLRFGCPMIVLSLAVMLVGYGERPVLARFGSVVAVAHYAVAHTLASLILLVPAAANQVLMPAFTRLRMEADHGPLQRLHDQIQRLYLLSIPPSLLVLFVTARPFLTLWAGEEYGRESMSPFLFLAAGFAFTCLGSTPTWVMLAAGKSRVLALYYACEVVPLLACVALLSHWFGAAGAAAACGARAVLDAVFMCITCRRVTGISFSPLDGRAGRYVRAVAVLFVPVLLAGVVQAGPRAWAAVVVGALVAYGWVVWSVVLTVEERSRLVRVVPRRPA